MGKRKHGPALFELMKGTRRDPVLVDRPGPPGQPESCSPVPTAPATRGPPQCDAGDQPLLEHPPVAPGPVEPLRPAEPVPHLSQAAAEVEIPVEVSALEAAPPSPPVLGLSGGRLRVSLSQGGASITAAIVLLVLTAVYFAGARYGAERERRAIQGPVESEIEQRRQAKSAKNLFEGIGEDPTQAASDPVIETPRPGGVPGPEPAEETTKVLWIPGYTYIVVQDFRADARGDAVGVQDYLTEHGIQSAVLELGGSGTYRYRLMTVTGFNRDDPVQKKLADEYIERVRRLGRTFAEGGGRYDFESAYFKKLTGDRW